MTARFDWTMAMRLARPLRALGFRWVFPIGTLPIPYHPAVALAFALLPPAWIAWLAVSGLADGARPLWWQPLIPALAIGALLSVPILSWAMMVFRAPIAQAMLITGAMLLLAIDVAAGRAAPGWAALPIGFVALYLVQRIGGTILLARLRRDAQALVPIDPAGGGIVLAGAAGEPNRARRVIAEADIAWIAVGSTMVHWLPPPAIAALRAACGAIPPPGWSLPPDDAPPIVMRPIDAAPVDAVTVTLEPYRATLWLASGALQRLRVHGAGIDRAVIHGAARIVARVPVFLAFHWTAIFGGRSGWQIGFARAAPVPLGREGSAIDLIARAFAPRTDGGGRTDDARPLIALIAADAEAERARIDAFWRSIAEHPDGAGDGAVMRRLRDHPALIRAGDGARLVAWLAAAKAARLRGPAANAATLLERLPEAEFAAAAPLIRRVLDSRILAGQWRLGANADLASIPRDCPRFGNAAGFGLMRYVPGLYDRLAALGPAEAEFVAALRRSLAPEDRG